jgi:hypothetical protein
MGDEAMATIPFSIEEYLSEDILEWLLEGDVSVQYQVHRDLLDSPERTLSKFKARIPKEGWGKEFLDRRQADGWWPGWYSPKWTSTHYTLLELADIGMDLSGAETREVCRDYVNGMWADGAYDRKRRRWFDACIAAMLVIIASKSGLKGSEKSVEGIVDYLLEKTMPDGGWNCGWWREPESRKSSVHTTISVLEAFRDLDGRGREGIPAFPRKENAVRSYRREERLAAEGKAAALLMRRRVFMKLSSDDPIKPSFMKASFPCRWHFDYLRALEWFASVGRPRERAMDPALSLLRESRLPDGTWSLQLRHSGEFHFHMERVGKPSRWDTLRALRVIRSFGD